MMRRVAISDELLERVEEVARRRGLAVEAQVEEWLRAALDPRDTSGDLVAAFDAIAAMTPPGVTQTDSLTLLREDRDR